MALSSGTKSLISEAASWVAAAALITGGYLYFHELKGLTVSAVGLMAGPQAPARGERLADAPAGPKASGVVQIRAGVTGHFHTEAEINGREVAVLVDTGATMVSLTYEDAERAGIYLKPSDFTRGVTTANGVARVAPVMLDRVSIGNITVRNVKATVSERGRLSTTLLGMSFLGRLERVDMRSGILVLKE